MRTKLLLLFLFSLVGFHYLLADSTLGVGLSGQVSSQEEGPMEGVLVSAKADGSNITVTVASDQMGHFSFPYSRLPVGKYSLRIRAVGYELDGPVEAEVNRFRATMADLKLRKAKDLSSQLTNAEWMLSMPGTDDPKSSLLNCIQCHTLQLIVRSQHDPDEFLQVLERMGTYANQAFPLHPQKRLADRLLEARGEQRQRNRQEQAKYLSTLNLSSGSPWPYVLKTLPRPKGRGTRMIITEYDLPRRTIEPHDAIVDSEGMVWYSNFGEQSLASWIRRLAR